MESSWVDIRIDSRSQVPVAHCYNPSYSGGRDRRIAVQSQPRQIVVYQNTHHKKGMARVAQGEGPQFKLQYCKKRTDSRRQYLQAAEENHGQFGNLYAAIES
jgi:hypothetical protein